MMGEGGVTDDGPMTRQTSHARQRGRGRTQWPGDGQRRLRRAGRARLGASSALTLVRRRPAGAAPLWAASRPAGRSGRGGAGGAHN